jgi:ElaB/YqjD/DUF883 family membrane-anchored ribosome-binding protein
VDVPDPDRVRWLQKLAAACEQVLARPEGDRTDPSYDDLRQDVQQLLARIRAELGE